MGGTFLSTIFFMNCSFEAKSISYFVGKKTLLAEITRFARRKRRRQERQRKRAQLKKENAKRKRKPFVR